MEDFWLAVTAIATAANAVVALLSYLDKREQGDDEPEA